MGNCSIQKQEKEVIGNLEIILDKTRIRRGDSLTGRIILNLKKEYPGRQLCVRVRGIETIKKGVDLAENEIFGDTVLLLALSSLKEGDHKFFFEYLVPEKLEGQFSSQIISLEPEYAVSMVYQIKGILEPVELLEEEFQKIQGATYFSFLADVGKEGISSTSTGNLKNEYGEYGQVEITLKSGKSAYEGGETAEIEININNTEVIIPLEQLSFHIVREIQFSGKSKNAYIKTIRKEFTLPQEKKNILSQDIKFERGELDQIGIKRVNFELPYDLYPSFQGKQFSCRYFFELYAHYVKGPTNFIDAKARLKLQIIPERMRNYTDSNKNSQKATSVTKSKISNDFYSSQIRFGNSQYNNKENSIKQSRINSNVVSQKENDYQNMNVPICQINDSYQNQCKQKNDQNTPYYNNNNNANAEQQNHQNNSYQSIQNNKMASMNQIQDSSIQQNCNTSNNQQNSTSMPQTNPSFSHTNQNNTKPLNVSPNNINSIQITQQREQSPHNVWDLESQEAHVSDQIHV